MNKQITQDDIIYFVVTDRFFGRNKRSVTPADTSLHGGTLDGILEKLEYLLELGVTAIWVTPVYENIVGSGASEPYHYYWPRNFERLDQRLLDGSQLLQAVDMSTFGSFVDAFEARGLKVVLDMVVNHAGYGAQVNFPADWFNHNGQGDIKGELAGLPDFNHDNPQVLDFFINNIEDWITKGKVTNIRMDTVKHVEPKFWHYFKAHKMLRDAGAKEVHMRISSPPTKWPCYYGIDTPTRGELIASSHSVEEINQYITSDTLAYLPLDAMIDSVVRAKTGVAGPGRSRLPVLQAEKPLTKDSFCLACWTGEYPIEFTPHPRQRQMRLLDL